VRTLSVAKRSVSAAGRAGSIRTGDATYATDVWQFAAGKRFQTS